MQVKKHEGSRGRSAKGSARPGSATDDGVWAPKESVGYWVNRASRLLLKRHDDRLRALGLSMGQVPVLDALMDGLPRSQKEIAARAGVKQPTMAEMLARMERDGVIRRSPDPDDGRGSLIALTAWATERLAAARTTLYAGEREATAGLSAVEAMTLRALLQRVVGSLEAAEPEAGTAPSATSAPSARSATVAQPPTFARGTTAAQPPPSARSATAAQPPTPPRPRSSSPPRKTAPSSPRRRR